MFVLPAKLDLCEHVCVAQPKRVPAGAEIYWDRRGHCACDVVVGRTYRCPGLGEWRMRPIAATRR